MVFWTFRIMVGLGMLMIATGLIALVLHFRKALFTTRWFHLWCVAMTPAGFVAVLAGWFVTEVGRQPYIVFNVLRTSETISPVAGGPIAISLAAFVITYGLVFTAGAYYILKLIGKGPDTTDDDAYGSHGVDAPPLVTDLAPQTGGEDV
jgi:cytochrome d ubiquinol oxidase subunit I